MIIDAGRRQSMAYPSAAEIALLDNVVKSDPLYAPTEADINLLWRYRYYLIENPKALPKFLVAVAWNDCNAVEETHRQPPPAVSLCFSLSVLALSQDFHSDAGCWLSGHRSTRSTHWSFSMPSMPI